MRICVRVIQTADGRYTAICPSLPGCTTHGVSCTEAVIRLDEAAKAYVASVNNFVPEKVEHVLEASDPEGEPARSEG